MHRVSGWIVVVALVGATGCEGPERLHGSAPETGPRPAHGADKAALFGDPTLVPTREGERARHELALAQEIEHAIALLPGVSRTRVNVEQPGPRTAGPTPEPMRVLVVVVSEPTSEPELLDEKVRSIAHAVVGPDAALEVMLETVPTPREVPRPSWPLLLSVLGLGACGGTLVERARRRLRARGGRLR